MILVNTIDFYRFGFLLTFPKKEKKYGESRATSFIMVLGKFVVSSYRRVFSAQICQTFEIHRKRCKKWQFKKYCYEMKKEYVSVYLLTDINITIKGKHVYCKQ